MTLRTYPYKDVVMLMAAKTLLLNMGAHPGELGQVRTNWTEAYLTALILKIDTAIENFLKSQTYTLKKAFSALK